MLSMLFFAIPAVISSAFLIWSLRSKAFVEQLSLAFPVQVAASLLARDILHTRVLSVPVYSRLADRAYTARSLGMVSEDRSSKTPKSRDSTFFRFWSALIALKISPLM